MKKHISLLVAAVMVLTLIYTPAGLVYGAEEEGPQADSPAAAAPAEEPTEESEGELTEEPTEEPEVEPTEEPTEETTGSDTGEIKESVNAVANDGAQVEGQKVDLADDGSSTGDTGETTQKIGEIQNLTVTDQTDTSIALKWDAFIIDAESDPVVSADSYKVFLDNKDLFPEGFAETTKTITGLNPKTDYIFRVEAYKSGEEKPVAEGTINSYTYPATPAAPTTLTAQKSFPNYVISWTMDTTKAGYQFQYRIAGGKWITTDLDAATNSQIIKKLKNGKNYYFRVRVKDQYKDSPVYWSSWKTDTVKAATTGWKTVIKKGKKNGKKYYYVNGVMQKNKEFWLGKLKYYVDKNGVWRGGSKYMWNRCKKQTSGTDTMLVTSRNRHTVCIFKKVDGTWCCQYEWLCSVGEKGNKTPHGKFYVRSKKKSFGKGHTCWYATRYHKKYPKAAFHSVLYKKGSKTKIKDGRLGKNISNGCVRLPLKWAKWIYDNVKKKSRIYIY